MEFSKTSDGIPFPTTATGEVDVSALMSDACGLPLSARARILRRKAADDACVAGGDHSKHPILRDHPELDPS